MSQPAAVPAKAQMSEPERSNRARFAEAYLTTQVSNAASQPPPDAAGADVALHVLETTLIGGDVSPQTNQLIHTQISQISTANSTDTLNFLTALVLGSPEFQLR